MRYVTPRVVDYGSIADHTFTNAPGGCGPKVGNIDRRCRDTFCEYSHTTGVDQCGDVPTRCNPANAGENHCP
jgi:hypothetical protein